MYLLGRKVILVLALGVMFNSIEASSPIDLNSQDFHLDNLSSSQSKSSDNSAEQPSTKTHGGDVLSILRKAEEDKDLPEGLLRAIARVESNCNPNAVNVKGKGHYFKTAQEAANFVNERLAQGQRNISVGCVQLLYVAHKRAFNNSVNNMLDVEKNAQYAAEYLKSLYKKYGSWRTAVSRYHSGNSTYGARYVAKISKHLPDPSILDD